MYQPVWEGVIEGYTKNYISRNLWRFEIRGFEFDDLLHEAWLVFATCRDKYQVEDPKHFMGLYKTSLHNYFYDLMKRCIEEKTSRHQLGEEESLEDAIAIEEESTLRVLLTQAPIEVKQVLSLMFHAPTELLQDLGFCRPTTGRQRSMTNTKLCRMFGYDPKEYDLIGSVQSFLKA